MHFSQACFDKHSTSVHRWHGLIVVLLVLGGCRAEEPPSPLRIAVNPWPGYSFVYLAEELGFCREEGVSVRLLELASLADARRVFEQGQADVVFCTLVEVLLMNDTDSQDPVRVLAATDYSNGSDMLLARSGIESLTAIRGRRIGVEPDSVDGLSVFLALKSVGLTIGDVTLVPLAQAEMSEAIKTGRVDAVQIYPPASDAVECLDGVHRLWDSSQAPGTILDVLAARESMLGARDHEMRALLRAYRRAQRFYREHPQEAVAILARRCRISEDDLVRSLDGMRLLADCDAETQSLFDKVDGQTITQRVAEGLVSIGMLERVPLQTPFDSRFLNSIAP